MTKEMRLYGPPGTGKTTWVAEQACKYAEKYGGDQVSMCSLTNAAIKEVVSREIPIPKKNISTLHSRCKRVLYADSPAETDARIFREENKEWSSTSGSFPCLPNHMLSRKDRDESFFNGGQMSLFEHSQILRQQLIPKDRWPELTRRFSNAWLDWCKQTGRMDFTGWLEAVLESGGLPPQRVVFVDEAQDHTPLQLAVIRSWKANTVILVGDDDQCCYEWSGSVPDAFFKKTANLAAEKVLSQSYRIPRATYEIADRIVKKIHYRKPKEYHPRDSDGTVTRLDYTLSDAQFSGDLPKGLLNGSGESHMVIASCAYMLNPIIQSLKDRRIPFHNPYRPDMNMWNPLRSFLQCIRSYNVGDRMWTGNEAATWAKLLRAKRVFKPRMKQRFINLCDSLNRSKLEAKDIDKYFMPEYKHKLLSQDISILKEKASSSAGYNQDYAWDVYESGDYNPKITVGTVHSVKGGEADNVYIFPDLSASGLKEYLGRNSDRVYRLFYVGVTRTRKNLFLCSQDDPFKAIQWG